MGRTCDRCAGDIPTAARTDARFCSTACQQARWYDDNNDRLRQAAAAWKASNREAANEAEHRRRARKLGSQTGPIDREAVWVRDEGICWICETPVDPDAVYPAPRSPSLDHVIPLIRGGDHVMDNVALAHLRCNISKKDKVLDRVPRWARMEVMSDAVA